MMKLNKMVLTLIFGLMVLIWNIYSNFIVLSSDIDILFIFLISILFFILLYLGTLSSKTIMSDLRTNKDRILAITFIIIVGFVFIFITLIPSLPLLMDLIANLIGIWFLLIAYRLYTGIRIKLNEKFIIFNLFLITISLGLYNIVTQKYKPIIYSKWSLLYGIFIFIIYIVAYIIFHKKIREVN